MLGASFLPARFRNDHTRGTTANPGYLNRLITPFLQSLSQRAFTHPIRTIVFVALLASTSYIGLLEGSLFDDANAERDALGSPDFNSLVEQSRRLRLGEGTAWKWQVENGKLNSTVDAHTQHLALLTLVFPDSRSKTSPRSMPSIEKVPLNDEALARPLPSMSDPLFPASQDSTLAFSMPFHKTSKFLDLVRELPSEADTQHGILTDSHGATSWAMKARKSSKSASPNTMRRWLSNSWTNLVDLIKVCSIYRSKLSHLADEFNSMRNHSISS